MKRLLWMALGLAALLVLPVGVASADPGDGALSPGASGDDVAQLQQELTAAGYAVPATGYYGAMTGRAVEAFQEYADLPVTGQADDATIQALQIELTDSQASPSASDEGLAATGYDDPGPYAAPWMPYQGGSAASSGRGPAGGGSFLDSGTMGGYGSGGMMGGRSYTGPGSGMMGRSGGMMSSVGRR